MGIYATVADLRADPAIPDAAPPTDAELEAKIADAEDLIDRLLGPVGVDAATGRALTPSVLADWQAGKLERATVILARTAYADAAAFAPPRAKSIEGPSFKLTDLRGGMSPAGEVALRQAVALLDQAYLRRLAARARP